MKINRIKSILENNDTDKGIVVFSSETYVLTMYPYKKIDCYVKYELDLSNYILHKTPEDSLKNHEFIYYTLLYNNNLHEIFVFDSTFHFYQDGDVDLNYSIHDVSWISWNSIRKISDGAEWVIIDYFNKLKPYLKSKRTLIKEGFYGKELENNILFREDLFNILKEEGIDISKSPNNFNVNRFLLNFKNVYKKYVK